MPEEENKPRPMTLEDWYDIRQGQAIAKQAQEEALLALARDMQPVDRSGWRVLYPLRNDPDLKLADTEMRAFLSLPVRDVPFLAEKYLNMVETERTNRMCRCEWIIHPDDLDKPEGKRRIARGAQAANCPVHTKLGFLLYFFDWAFLSECSLCPPDCKKCKYTVDCGCGIHIVTRRDPIEPDDSEITQDITAESHGD